MKRSILLKVLLVPLVGLAVFVTAIQMKFSADENKLYESKPFAIHNEVVAADVALGKRLYSVRAGCIDCHGADLSGAMVMDNPAMGSISGANITPFALAQWSDEEIARAIRYGVHRTGRSLRFMPSFDYKGLSLGDTAALVAYLRSVPAVEKPSRANSFGPVAKILSFFGQMPVMFPARALDLRDGFTSKPEEGPTAEFGRYLANACMGCHGAEFHGGKIPGGDPSWPEAPSLRLGASSLWSEASFREVIKTGVSAVTKQKLRPPMPIALLAQMDDIEVKALWEFLGRLK